MSDTAIETKTVRYVLESIYPSRRMMEELKRLQVAADEEQIQSSVVSEPPVITRKVLKNRIMKTLSRNIKH